MQKDNEDTLTRLRRWATEAASRAQAVVIAPEELMALIESAEIVQTDYLLLSASQQSRALRVLKELE